LFVFFYGFDDLWQFVFGNNRHELLDGRNLANQFIWLIFGKYPTSCAGFHNYVSGGAGFHPSTVAASVLREVVTE